VIRVPQRYRDNLSWHNRASISLPPLSLRSMSRSRSRFHELTPCRSIQSAPCRRQAEIERAQVVRNRSQLGLPRSTGSAPPVFGRTQNAHLKSSRMVLTAVGTTKVATKERQAASMDSIRQEWLIRTTPKHVIRDKIRGTKYVLHQFSSLG